MPKINKSTESARRDPEGVRNDILTTASEVFAESGLSGARVDEIAARTRTSKRMIYYYFGDKDGLYKACLEAAYAKVREGESALDLSGLSPDAALARIVAFTFDHHRQNPDFIRLVMIENIHDAGYLTTSEMIQSQNNTAIEKLSDIIQRGQRLGIFRADLDPVELHWHISALSFFNVSNKPTFSALFGGAIYSEAGQASLRDQAVEMILRYVQNPKGPSR